MHTTTGHWKLGLGLALVTTVLWSVLPIALKVLLGQMDAYSITWYRFLAAALILGAWQARRGGLPTLSRLRRSGLGLLTVAVLGLTGNYALYLLGLDYITPGAAQMVIQLAPVLLMIGGLIVFREHFGRLQWSGLVALMIGLLLFFNHRLGEIVAGLGAYSVGILFILASALAWACYAMAQKQLLNTLRSEQIMLLIYVGGAIVFLPPADIGSVADLDGLGIALLVFASLNTLIAYGSFAEALDHWEASRVSAVLALAPLITLVCVQVLALASDAVTPEPLNGLSIVGGTLVVAGSMTMSLSGRSQEVEDP